MVHVLQRHHLCAAKMFANVLMCAAKMFANVLMCAAKMFANVLMFGFCLGRR